MEDRMKTATDVAKDNHPHMGESLQDMIALDMDIYAGNVATIILGLKSVGEVKKYLRGLVDAGTAAEQKVSEYKARTASIPKSAPKKKRGA
jgi:hypothetical protein